LKKSYNFEILLPILTIITDAISITIAYFVSYWIRFFSDFQKIFRVEKGIPDIYGYIYFGLVTIPIWILVFQSFKMYRLNRSVFIFDELFIIIKCVTISLIFSIGIIFFFREFPYSRIVFVLIWINSTIFLTIGRYLILKLEKTLYNNNIGVKNVAVVGDNEMADKIYYKFVKDKFAGFNVLGYFTKEVQNNEEKQTKNFLGTYDEIPEKISELQIDKILISLPTSEIEDIYNIISKCEGINVEFLSTPDFIGILTSKLKIEEVDGVPFMKLKSLPMNIWNRILKRVFDFIFSFIILIINAPVFLIVAIMIKLDSKGPVFYKQERVGLDGKKFLLLKFRSMYQNAETEGPQFAKKDDQRRTWTGKYLRKFSIDELPQFINVLRGDMSIVGPRPEREYFINKMKLSVKRYLERHRVKCGITGWAQVNGFRGPNTSIQARIEYDIYYIENWTLTFDLKIILKTLKEIFFSKTAF
jgi:Undecaprenyl-phosphate glucose phosphotransferase